MIGSNAAAKPPGGPRLPQKQDSMNHFSDKVNLIWDIADTLRGPYHPPDNADDFRAVEGLKILT